MNLIILISGSIEKIYDAHNFDEFQFEVVKIDEKDLAKPKKILKILTKEKYTSVFYACIETNLQRFHFFMLLYQLISLKWKGGIIDEQGKRLNFSFLRFIFLYMPLFLIETISSFAIVLYYKLKIPFVRWRLKIR